MTKSKAGRPTVMTPEVVSKLEEGFTYGFTDAEACLYAGITKPALYEYCKKHPNFTDRKETLKKQPNMLAKRTIYDKLADNDDTTAKWQLERKDASYSNKSKVDHTTSDGSMAPPTKIEIVAATKE